MCTHTKLIMELSDKSLLLNILHLPRLGLSPEQVQKIEHVIDGTVPATAPLTMSYEAAAERIGLTAKNRAKTIVLWVRQGKLNAVVPPGCKRAIGVTVESVERFAASWKAVKPE